MSNQLKESLRKKMDVTPSTQFDSLFFDKLEKSRKPSVFSNWITWAVSGCATASVLFIALSNYHIPTRHAFNHQEYVENALEIQGDLNESVVPLESSDLTVNTLDEI